jgi:hypothetical protein
MNLICRETVEVLIFDITMDCEAAVCVCVQKLQLDKYFISTQIRFQLTTLIGILKANEKGNKNQKTKNDGGCEILIHLFQGFSR